MGENMYRMVVTDLDGTLLNSKKQLGDDPGNERLVLSLIHISEPTRPY